VQSSGSWEYLWARGFYVDTVGRTAELIRNDIHEQDLEDRKLEQMQMSERSKE
jgi:REP element-mobilizing transposase RayT